MTILTSLDRKDLDASMIKNGDIKDLVSERASRAFEAGADGVIASPQECISIRDLPNSKNKLIVTPVLDLSEQNLVIRNEFLLQRKRY